MIASLLLSLCTSGWSQEAEPQASALRPDQCAFIEIVLPDGPLYANQLLSVGLRVGIERRFLEESMVQLFRRELDVPVQVRATWLQDLPGARFVESAGRPSGSDAATLAIDEEIASATRLEDRTRDGRRFAVLEITRELVPQRAGELRFAAAELRFAYATRFREDLLAGRVALDRHDALVNSQAGSLQILSLPERGRPPEFSGAVGNFSLRAAVDRRNLTQGESLILTLTVEGHGNLEFLEPLRLDALEGFHLLGRIEGGASGQRSWSYDLRPDGPQVRSVPAIELFYFDPGPPAGYRSASSAPVAIRVRPGQGSGGAEGPSEPAVEPGGAGREPDGPDGATWELVLLALVGGALLLLGLRLRPRRTPLPAVEDGRRRSPSTLQRLGQPDADPGELLTEFLAERLDCLPAAVIASDLAERLAAAGAPGELAGRAATLLDELVASRYGGRPAPDAAERTRAAIAELDPHLSRPAPR